MKDVKIYRLEYIVYYKHNVYNLSRKEAINILKSDKISNAYSYLYNSKVYCTIKLNSEIDYPYELISLENLNKIENK